MGIVIALTTFPCCFKTAFSRVQSTTLPVSGNLCTSVTKQVLFFVTLGCSTRCLESTVLYCAQETLLRSSDTAHYIRMHNAHVHQRKHDITIGYIWGLRNRFQSLSPPLSMVTDRSTVTHLLSVTYLD